jgi:hypothetical protein
MTFAIADDSELVAWPRPTLRRGLGLASTAYTVNEPERMWKLVALASTGFH